MVSILIIYVLAMLFYLLTCGINDTAQTKELQENGYLYCEICRSKFKVLLLKNNLT